MNYWNSRAKTKQKFPIGQRVWLSNPNPIVSGYGRLDQDTLDSLRGAIGIVKSYTDLGTLYVDARFSFGNIIFETAFHPDDLEIAG